MTPPSTDRAAGAGALAAGFGRRLEAAVAERESQVVLGLDPDPGRLWPLAVEAADAAKGGPETPTARAAGAVAAHCRALIDAAGPACVAVKPQVACFERLGATGWWVLDAVCAHARQAGLLVIADAKRGDIDVSAAAYGQAFLTTTPTPWGEVESLGADALTVNPYMGADTLQTFASAARDGAAGLFVLVRTSNPGAADLEDLELAGGGRVWERAARLVDALDDGDDGPIGSFGAVVGATQPEHLARARELLPRAPFLLPGIGAQGGRVEDLAPAFAPGRAGGLVSASRSIARAGENAGGDAASAARAEAERLREAAWKLA